MTDCDRILTENGRDNQGPSSAGTSRTVHTVFCHSPGFFAIVYTMDHRAQLIEYIKKHSFQRSDTPFSLSLHFMNYNFCGVRQTLRVPFAMEAGVADLFGLLRKCFIYYEADEPNSSDNFQFAQVCLRPVND